MNQDWSELESGADIDISAIIITTPEISYLEMRYQKTTWAWQRLRFMF